MRERKTFLITGDDTVEFLQGLVTNDVSGIGDGLQYAALLTPQGKLIADFFLSQRDGGILMDVDAAVADSLAARLSMYKLRAAVEIAPAGLFVHVGTGDALADGLVDPRDASLGWRAYRESPQTDAPDLASRRVAATIPEFGVELGPDSYILEAGFERMNGVDFRKGCYVGQEVTARMKHKTDLRKGFVTVDVEGSVPEGTAIERDGRAVGKLFTQANGRGIAYLRFDRAGEGMTAQGVAVLWSGA